MIRYLSDARSYLPKMLLLAAAGLFLPASVAQADPGQAPPQEEQCKQGQFCAWPDESYGGEIVGFDLRTANPGDCISLPESVDARSFANRMDRYVTVYEGRDCSTEGDFSTYPGGGTYTPHAPFMVRAIQIDTYT